MSYQSTKVVPLRVTASLIAVLVVLSLSVTAFAQSEKVIYEEAGEGLGFPNMVVDPAGNLYGALYANGPVFELSPPAQAGGSWTFTSLSEIAEVRSLAIDENGNLYGTTRSGGVVGTDCPPAGCGIVFELSPPVQPGGAWTETTLYEFLHGTRGNLPPDPGGITVGPEGVLYGACEYGGNAAGDGFIFRLTPPKQGDDAWVYKVLYEFQGNSDGAAPTGYFVFDQERNLYGTTIEGGANSQTCDIYCGTVFELSPPAENGGAWTKAILHSFGGPDDGVYPYPGVIRDKNGNLYGSTYVNNGIVFELSPPTQTGGPWTETILHYFTSSPDGSGPLGLAWGANEIMFGATWSGGSGFAGTVFQMDPPAESGGAWIESILYNFAPDYAPNGTQPSSNVTYKSGAIYGGTLSGANGAGVIYEVRP
jgi:hypothetical protein